MTSSSDSNEDMASDTEGQYQLVENKKKAGKKRKKNGGSSDENLARRQRLDRQGVDQMVSVQISCKKINLGKLSPVRIAQWLEKAVADVEQVKSIREGIKVRTTEDKARQMKAALKVYEGESVLVEIIKPNIKLRGVLYRVPESVEMFEIEDSCIEVDKAEKIGKAGTVFLTFSNLIKSVPESIKIGYIHCKVHEFIPQPLRCFKCQRFGHVASGCRGKEKCLTCGGEHNVRTCETENQKCSNCGGSHKANSKECPVYQKEKLTIEVKVTQKVSYAEATKRVEDTRARQERAASLVVPETQSSQVVEASNPTEVSHSGVSRSGVSITNSQLIAVIVKLFFLFKKEVFVKEDRLGQIVDTFSKIGNIKVDRKIIQSIIEEHFPKKNEVK